jgi:phosphoribosylformylglycinamidine synthase
MLWEVDVLFADPANDHAARAVVAGAADLGIAACTSARVVTGWLIEGELSRSDIERVATTLLADPVTEQFTILELTGAPSTAATAAGPSPAASLPLVLHVLPKPGVTDPAAQSVLAALRLLGLDAEAAAKLGLAFFLPSFSWL